MIIDTLKTLTSFKTINIKEQPEEFEKLYNYVQSELSTFQIRKREFKNKEYTSLYLGTVENPDLLLTAHVDVVPAPDEMFDPREENNKLFGRGVLDMKFAVAIFIEIFKTVPHINDYSIGILLTPDEEVGGFNGMKYVLENSELNPKVVILPDGGAQMSIEYAEKGILHAKISTKGKSAHGSRPWLGSNAIDKVIDVYQKIKQIVPNPSSDQWVSTVNLGKINGGTATNVVPEQASIELDFRVISEEDRTKIKDIFKNLAKDPDIIIEEAIEGPSFELDKNNQYLKTYLDIAEEITGTRPPLIPSAGSSDARFFAEKNIPVIINRPVGEGHHSENEWIDIESLTQYNKVLTEFAKKFKV